MKLQLITTKNVSGRNISFLRYFGFLAVFLAMSVSGWGQVTIAVQDFETSPATPTITFSNTLGSNSTGTSGSGSFPANTNLFVSGSRGWKANDEASTLIFLNQSLSGYTDCFVDLRLAGISFSTTTNGIDAGDIARISISADGGSTYSSEVEIIGSASNQKWDFTATGNSTTTYDGNNTANLVTSSNGVIGISTVRVNLPNTMSQVKIKIELTNNSANELWVIDDVRIRGTVNNLTTPPTLAADGTSNNVDSNIDITFPTNGTWESAITAVKIGGTALTLTTDYVISAGNIQLIPSGGNTLLRTAGSKNVTVEADGYSVASVTQQINAGAANKLAIATQPTAPATNGAVLGTQPVVYIQDQYGNATTSTATVTAAVGAGTWTLGGTASANGISGTATFSGLTATSTAAVTGATISFTSTGLTGVTSSTFNIPAPVTTPTITVLDTTVPAMSAVVGSTDAETITIGGTNLTGDITLALSGTNAAMFSVATTPSPLTSAGGTATITYTPTVSGSHTATLTLSSAGATDVTRTLNGTATLAVPVATNATGISTTGFTANWDAVSGATGYDLNVYTKTTGGTSTPLSENFNLFSAGTANSGANSTDVSASLNTYTQTTGWTGSKVYQAGGTAKMGSSSALGYIVTPQIDLSNNSGNFNLSFNAVAWSGDATELKIYLNDVLVYTVTGLNNDANYTFSPFSIKGTSKN